MSTQKYANKLLRRGYRAYAKKRRAADRRAKQGLRPLVFQSFPKQTRATGALKRSERRGTSWYYCR